MAEVFDKINPTDPLILDKQQRDGMEILMTEVFDKINPTDPLILDKQTT